MSESLIPYVKGEDHLVIVIDSREAASAQKVVKCLREADVEVIIRALPKGDYVISDRVVIERKTVQDFAYTLTRRNLFDQVFTLKEAYECPILLLEGYIPLIFKFSKIPHSAVWGAMFTLAKNGIRMVHTMNYRETAGFLIVAAKQEQLLERRKPRIHPIKKIETIPQAQLFFMSSLPNIGRDKALAILKRYKTPMNALLNVDKWAEDIKGLGPKIAGKVKSVLMTPFEGETEEQK